MIILNFPFRLISKDNSKIVNRQGRFFLTKEYKEFEAKIKSFAILQYQGKPLAGPVSVEIEANFANKVHADLFNLPKSVMDSLQGVAFINDRQIKAGKIIVVECSQGDSFRVKIRNLRK